MSEKITSPNMLVCKPTSWFLWRALAMLTMSSVFSILFFKDGMWGYREKNLHYYVHDAFVQAGKDFQKMNMPNELDWKNYVSAKKVKFPNDAAAILPLATQFDMPWPEEIAEGYGVLSDIGGQTGAAKLWEDYSGVRKWSSETEDKPFKKGKIKEQFVAFGVTGLLFAVTLFFLIRTMNRSISADEEALYSQDGIKIAYTDMVRFDIRKWDSKGIALIYYKQGDEEKKAKIDGMVYGQFKEEDGAPAEKLFAHVMNRFKGEVIEYTSDGDEQTSDDFVAGISDDNKDSD